MRKGRPVNCRASTIRDWPPGRRSTEVRPSHSRRFRDSESAKAPCRLAARPGRMSRAYVQMVEGGKVQRGPSNHHGGPALPGCCEGSAPPDARTHAAAVKREPVAIPDLKRLRRRPLRPAGRSASNASLLRPETVAIIGSGPAGLSAASTWPGRASGRPFSKPASSRRHAEVGIRSTVCLEPSWTRKSRHHRQLGWR